MTTKPHLEWLDDISIFELDTFEADELRRIVDAQETFVRRFRAKRDDYRSKMRRALFSDYATWLTDYEAQGGKATNLVADEMGKDLGDFFVALEDLRVLPSHGASTIHIIFPEGIRYLGGESGHGTIFLRVEGVCTTKGPHWVPKYLDTP